MVKFETNYTLDEIKDSAFFRKDTIIASLNIDNVIKTITIDKNLEVDWCPTGNFDTDPVTHYTKVTAFPRDLKILMKENSNWRKDKRVRVTVENNFVIDNKIIKLNSKKNLSEIMALIEKEM